MKNKFAIVTGASTGIGRAVAIELAGREYHVILVGRNEAKLLETESIIKKVGDEAEVMVVDFSDLGSIRSFIKAVKDRITSIDVLANIAGVWHGKDEVYAGKDFETFDEKVILDTFSVGLTAPAVLTHYFIPLMTSGSSIINLSGTFENGGKGWLPYYVSKRAIEDFTIGLAEELKDKGIKVNCVSPSDTATEQYKRFFPDDAKDAQTPEDVARLFLEILKKDATGKVFVIKGGKVTEGFHK
jgi:3-oxoacyl-[acyl-carrier protein] reductase